jgi:hypothetical protein
MSLWPTFNSNISPFTLGVNLAVTTDFYSLCMGKSINVLGDADVCQSADLMIEEHGMDASLIARLRADELLINGNIDGYQMWKRIVTVIDNVARHGSLPDILLNSIYLAEWVWYKNSSNVTYFV